MKSLLSRITLVALCFLSLQSWGEEGSSQIAIRFLKALSLPTDKTNVEKQYVGKTRAGEKCTALVRVTYGDRWPVSERHELEFSSFYVILWEGNASENGGAGFQFSGSVPPEAFSKVHFEGGRVNLNRDQVSSAGSPMLPHVEVRLRTELALQAAENGSISELRIANFVPGWKKLFSNRVVACLNMSEAALSSP